MALPYGFTTSVTALLVPYLLRKYGMPVDRISEVVAISILPAIWAFLWSPLADTGIRRRSWVIVSAFGAALSAAAAIFGIHGSVPLVTSLLFLSNAFAGLMSSATGALLTTMPESLRGRFAGWSQAGNVGGSAIGGGLVILLADHASLPMVAAAIVPAMVLPSLAALLIEEAAPIRQKIGPQLGGMFHDLRDLLRSHRTWLGLFFFLSPVGTAAVTNLISGVGQDYHASNGEVALITGLAGGLLSAAGCFIGGVVADKMSRMMAYALAGVLSAIFGAWLAFAPSTPFTYGAGFAGYSLAAGFAYAVYSALLLDVVGRRQHAAALAYSALNATGNASISYMTWLDGLGYKHWGVRGLMGTDAFANASFAIVLFLVAIYAGHHWHHRGNDAVSPAEV